MLKFRAWDVEDKCWIPEDQVAVTSDGKVLTSDENSDRWAEECIPVLVSLSTGLHDRNGKEIFGGDILDIDPGGPGTPYVVFVDDRHGYRFMIGKDQICKNDATKGEVLGNIYENPLSK